MRRSRLNDLPKPARALLVAGILLALFALSEVFFWAASVAIYKTTGKVVVPHAMMEHFHPLFNKQFAGLAPQDELENRFDPHTIYWYLPNLPQDLVKRRRWATDKLGFVLNDPADPRQVQRDLSRPKERYRIFVFGGSTSLGSNSQTTVAAFLQQALDREAPGRFEVVMSGMSGWSSINELMQAASRVLYLQPDLLVTFDGANDAIHSSFAREYRRNIHPRAIEIGHYVDNEVYRTSKQIVRVNAYPFFDALGHFYTPRALLRPFETFGFRWPSLINERERMLERLFGYKTPSLAFHPEAVEAYLTNLDSLGAVASVRGVRTIHVLQPTLATELVKRGEAARPEERAVMRRLAVGLNEAQVQKLTAAFNRFFEEAQAGFAARRGQSAPGGLEEWLDYSDFFAEADLADVYYDYVHYTDARTQELAEAIARDVLRVAGE